MTEIRGGLGLGSMNENLFNETFFKKNNYFRKESNISQDQLNDIQALIKNWQKNCESFNPDVDKETTDENEFVDILFKKILGYSGKGADSDNYNILPKFKVDGASATGKAGYADLALGYFSKSTQGGIHAEVVVEFKGQDSDNLTKLSNRTDKLSPVDQCWKYLVNHASAKWGIVTNFNEIRIYNKEKGQNVYETFYFNVPEEDKHKFLPLSTETEILKLISILKKENLLTTNGVSKTEELLKNKGVEETKVLKEFYLEYKSLRSQIFYEALKYNTQYETERPKSELLQLVQKFLDRIIFCWFCEDSREHLIPSNVLSADLIQAQTKDKYYNPQHFSIYGKVKDLFQAIDEGKAFGIESGYNGELFKVDALLDALKLPNFLFEKIAEIGMKYDFGDENELNVNILGHIFEQSISDLEEMRVSFQELDQTPKKIEKQHVMEFAKEVEVLEHKHTEFDAKKTKRKKEGVFYTPDYITRYMVENTVGAWLDEKFKLVEEKYKNIKRNKEFNIWIEFRDEYLCKIKILDPACGSGAFLIAAFNYLLAKHKEVYEKLKELRKKKESDEAYLLHPDNFDKTILENNLYGVDLNRESVEITKLALWLKTAVKNRKLNNLSDHIKCGNSLIDDKSVAGDLAFDWNKEFSNIMKAGGFDVVVGNPPYVNVYNMIEKERIFFNETNKYETTHLKYDIYILFMEKGIKLINSKGKISFIVPSVILSIPYGIKARKYILENTNIEKIIDFTGFKIFTDAVVENCIIILSRNVDLKNKINILKPREIPLSAKIDSSFITQQTFYNIENYQFRVDISPLNLEIIDKIKFNSIKLGSSFYISKGIVSYSKIDERKKDDFIFTEKLKPNFEKFLEGKDVSKYNITYKDIFIDYNYEIMSRPTFPELHQNRKILVRAMAYGLISTFDDNNYFVDQKLIICSRRDIIERYVPISKRPTTPKFEQCSEISEKYIVSIFNSKLYSFYYDVMLKGGISILPEDIRNIPFKPLKEQDQKPFIRLTDIMLSKNKELQEIQKKFTTLLVSDFKIEKLTEKLEDWYLLDWSDFANELKKKKISMSGKDEEKWLDRFDRLKKEALAIKGVIDSTDKEIDQKVYELYGLTGEEIKIVEDTGK